MKFNDTLLECTTVRGSANEDLVVLLEIIVKNFLACMCPFSLFITTFNIFPIAVDRYLPCLKDNAFSSSVCTLKHSCDMEDYLHFQACMQ